MSDIGNWYLVWVCISTVYTVLFVLLKYVWWVVLVRMVVFVVAWSGACNFSFVYSFI